MKFDDYYQHYLSLHRNKWCRRLHLLGQLATVLFVALVVFHALVVSPWAWLALLLTPFVVYVFAWSGHYFFEHNEPAAFKNPLWAKMSDWRMTWDILRGKIPF